MTLRTLWIMAQAKREQQRIHAVDIANTVASTFNSKRRVDWDRFVKTGQFENRQAFEIPMTPLIQKAYEQIKKDGRFILENLERN